jgi:methyl-accepting chemotaxis protein
VADSVRELAFKTAESTHEIQNMISVLQGSAVRAAEAMQNNKNIAHQSVAEANLAGDALMRIDKAISDMAQLNTHIVAASQDQTHTCTQINHSTGNISATTQKSAELTLRVEESAQQLAGVASDLEQVLRKFKL